LQEQSSLRERRKPSTKTQNFFAL